MSIRGICQRVLLSVLGAAVLSGCAQETLFQSKFDGTQSGFSPAPQQPVGTIRVDGPAGSVVVVDPPVTPSGKWVRVSKATPNSPVSGLQCNFSKFGGDGHYTFTTSLFIPQGSGVVTVQFEPFGQPVGTLTNFLHVDFMPDNTVRLDDDASTSFGSFQRGQPFILQVKLDISASSQVAHVSLAGATASGSADRTIVPAFRPLAHQFGAVRLFMGFPHVGSFQATNIVVTKAKN